MQFAIYCNLQEILNCLGRYDMILLEVISGSEAFHDAAISFLKEFAERRSYSDITDDHQEFVLLSLSSIIHCATCCEIVVRDKVVLCSSNMNRFVLLDTILLSFNSSFQKYMAEHDTNRL